MTFVKNIPCTRPSSTRLSKSMVTRLQKRDKKKSLEPGVVNGHQPGHATFSPRLFGGLNSWVVNIQNFLKQKIRIWYVYGTLWHLFFFGVNQPFIGEILTNPGRQLCSWGVSSDGFSCFPAVTGARESLETAPGSYKLILDNRKAWSGGCCLHVMSIFWTIGIEGGLTPNAIPGN